MGTFLCEVIVNKLTQANGEGHIQLVCGLWTCSRQLQQREKEVVTVVHVFDIVNLAMEPLGIDSLM